MQVYFKNEKGSYILNAITGIKPNGEKCLIKIDGVRYSDSAYVKDYSFTTPMYIKVDYDGEVINKEDLKEVCEHYILKPITRKK